VPLPLAPACRLLPVRLTCRPLSTLEALPILATADSGCLSLQHQLLATAAHEGGSSLSVAAARAEGRPWPASFASRPLSAAAGGEQQSAQRGAARARQRAAAAAEKEVVSAEEEFSAITDKIPQRPVTATEAGGYGLVIVAALGVRTSAHAVQRMPPA
jgi:hypothetical protein